MDGVSLCLGLAIDQVAAMPTLVCSMLHFGLFAFSHKTREIQQRYGFLRFKQCWIPSTFLVEQGYTQVGILGNFERTKEPLHPLYCRSQGRAGQRHSRANGLAKVLARKLPSIYYATCLLESRINQSSVKRGDINTTAGGRQIILNVMVTHPAAPYSVKSCKCLHKV